MTELMNGQRPVSADLGQVFTVRARFDGPLHVVEMTGELDSASRAAAIQACTSAEHLDVVVDLAGLVFMDCAGFGALIASTTSLQRRGGSLVLMNPVGEPRFLLALIEELGLGLHAPLRDDTLSMSPAATDPS